MLRDVERASNPWGKAQTERADWAAELGVRVLEPGEPAPEVLYWVGCAASFDERARTSAQSTAKLLKAAGDRLRDPRPARVVHRRPGAPDGQRVPLPGARRAERGHAQRGRRDEDRRELPPLLQHARQRVPGLRRQLRGGSPHRAARRAGARGAPRAQRRRGHDHLPRLLLPSPPQRRAGRPARAGGGGRTADRDGALRQAHVLLRRRAARTCGWRSGPERSTRNAPAKPPRRAPTRSRSPARSAPSCSTTACRARGDEMRVVDVSTLLAESLAGADREGG